MIDDWNGLKLILAVARFGGLSGAARALAINHSTAFRRLQAIEARLGHLLFERRPGGAYEPTPAGERMASAAERMEDETLRACPRHRGPRSPSHGPAPRHLVETLAYRVLTRHLAAFRRSHPGIVVELAIENRVLSLTRREADVALRPMRPKEGDLWGRKLAEVAWTAYGARGYLDAKGAPAGTADLATHALIVGRRRRRASRRRIC